jgi:hypothetical protein
MSGGPRHVCLEGGQVVGPGGWMPEHPSDFAWTSRSVSCGCNALTCTRCEASVTSSLGSDGRLYRCACTEHVAQLDAESLSPSDGEPHPARALPWRCAGHVPLPFPGGRIDGLTLTGPGLAQIVTDCLAGRPPHAPWGTSPLDGVDSATWLARLHALLEDATARSQIEAQALEALGSTEPLARAIALDFFLYHPAVPGAAHVARGYTARPQDYDGVPLPSWPAVDLADRFWRFVVARLGACPDDAEALSVARARLLEPAAELSVLLRVARIDDRWVLERAEALVAASPGLVGGLMMVLDNAQRARPQAADRLLPILGMLLAHPGPEPGRARAVARKYLIAGPLARYLDTTAAP